MKWMAPPNKREMALLLFSLTVFTLAYNIEYSIRLLGLDPVATQGIIYRRLGLGGSPIIDMHGRRPPGWRDQLEKIIIGDWPWDEGHVAGDGAERSQSKGTGRHGAIWLGKKDIEAVGDKVFGQATVDQAMRWWGDDIPQTKLLKHVPGYTILDQVILFNGTISIVTDHPDSFPPIPSIYASTGPGINKWEIISIAQAKTKIGDHGGHINGVTWMSSDSSAHNSTLFSLWRTYASLDPSIDAKGRTILQFPHRLVFPHIPLHSDANPPFHHYWIRRVRSNTGIHPYIMKAAFPQLSILYQEDWEDFHKMEVPYLIDRIVIADRSAAAKSVHLGQPVFSPPFEMEASQFWWEPIRRTLAEYFDTYEENGGKKVVTYMHRQGERNGPQISDNDHNALVAALRKMENKHGYEVHVVSSLDHVTGWSERMRAVVRSTVILGMHGNNLLNSVFMKPSPQTTLMEFFPIEMFSRDRELAANALGMHYIAWWTDRKFTSDDLPPVNQPYDNPVYINASAVVETIHEVLS